MEKKDSMYGDMWECDTCGFRCFKASQAKEREKVECPKKGL